MIRNLPLNTFAAISILRYFLAVQLSENFPITNFRWNFRAKLRTCVYEQTRGFRV